VSWDWRHKKIWHSQPGSILPRVTKNLNSPLVGLFSYGIPIK
jgi:hypothetical protein